MNKDLSHQFAQIQNWRLLTAVKRAECLHQIVDSLAEELTEQLHTKQVIKHILEQADRLDDSQVSSNVLGEYNHLYRQAGGKTLVIGLEGAQKLPIVAHVIAGLLTGNQVDVYFSDNDDFAQTLVTKFIAIGVPEAVITSIKTESQEQIAHMLNDIRVVQVATAGVIGDVQDLSAVLSKTQDRLAQVIAIVDQENLQEVFNPDYLYQFLTERVLTINTMAVAGRSELVSLNTA